MSSIKNQQKNHIKNYSLKESKEIIFLIKLQLLGILVKKSNLSIKFKVIKLKRMHFIKINTNNYNILKIEIIILIKNNNQKSNRL